MKRSFLSLPAAVTALLAAAIFAIAQAPQPQAGGPPPEHEKNPKPTNLKVLPKNLTGDQVHDIMHGWAGALGVHCDKCHAEDPNNIGPNGHPRLNFAADTKPEKAQARIMYKMTENINKSYLTKIAAAAGPDEKEQPKPVTCGTCHRGHLKPEAFVPPREEHHEH
ncbi:MAG: c-type cytochrome [Candidatus Sulfotelmatobacter sp.]